VSGIKCVDLVMIIQDDRGTHRLLSSKFELGADASAAVGPLGRHASADSYWKPNTEILNLSAGFAAPRPQTDVDECSDLVSGICRPLAA
jgi:lipid-binding SYLF domain-containing protein